MAGKFKCRKKSKLNSEVQSIKYCTLFRFSTRLDKFLITISIICSVLSGIALPFNSVLLGSVTGGMIKIGEKLEVERARNTTAARVHGQEIVEVAKTFSIYISALGFFLLITIYIALITINFAALNQVFVIRSIFFKSLLNQDISWYDLNPVGDFSSRISDDILKLEEGIGEKLVYFLFWFSTGVVGFVIAFVVGWKFALICIVSLPITFVIMLTIGLIIPKIAMKAMKANGEATAIAEEVFTSIRTVVAFSGQWKEIKRYNDKLVVAKRLNIKLSWISGFGIGLFWVIVFSSYALAFWYGVKLILKGEYEPKTIFIVFMAVLMGSMNIGYSSTYIKIFGTATAGGGKIFQVITNVPVINNDKYKGAKPSEVVGKINFNDVQFHYPSRNNVPVLRGLNLSIEPGETVALVGKSGCGKSTCIQLLQRFYDPISGSITLDGKDIRSLNLVWLREHIGVVNQEPVLFGMTIQENIKLGNLNATEEEIIQAAKEANAHDFIVNLPQGYDTLVGERGTQLSGGQKQRVAIARALVRNPAILLLDEATSALDTESEAKVQEALDNASRNCTTIIVAHRLTTVKNADKIVVVSEGQVIEEGKHDELMSKKGNYHNLVTSQVDVEKTVEGETNDKYEKSLISTKSEISKSQQSGIDGIAVMPKVERKANFCHVLKEVSPEWLQIIAGCIASIVLGGIVPIFATLFGGIIQVLVNDDKDYVQTETNKLSLYFFITGIVVFFAAVCEMVMFNVVSENFVLRLKRKMFEAILRQDMSWFDKPENGVGSLCARISSETAKVQIGGGEKIGTLFQAVSILCFAIFLSVYLEYRLGFIAIVMATLIALVFFFHTRFSNIQNKKVDRITETATKLAVEALTNIKTVVSLGREDKFYELYTELLRPSYRAFINDFSIRCLVYSLTRFFMYGTAGVCIYYGATLVRDDNLEIGVVFKITQAVIVGATSIGGTLAFIPNFQKGITAAIDILRFIKSKPKEKPPDKYIQIWNKPNVQYSHIKFSYPTRPDVQILNDLNLLILQGQTVALVGHSGCGKSTIIQLLERFYEPDSGKITIDNKDIRSVSLSLLRSRISIVSQEPSLFDKTIGENIAYGDNTRIVPKQEIIEAAKKANIHNFISSLPMGYDTNLGEKGKHLSGGQKQRIAIARALIRDPKILLLDEATSALDAESEKIVQETLDEAKQGRTCIMIAHRLSTIQDADVICVINRGKIEEMGTHSQLLSHKELYYTLHKSQS